MSRGRGRGGRGRGGYDDGYGLGRGVPSTSDAWAVPTSSISTKKHDDGWGVPTSSISTKKHDDGWGVPSLSISTKKLLEYAESDVSNFSDISSAALARVDLTKESSLTKVQLFIRILSPLSFFTVYSVCSKSTFKSRTCECAIIIMNVFVL